MSEKELQLLTDARDALTEVLPDWIWGNATLDNTPIIRSMELKLSASIRHGYTFSAMVGFAERIIQQVTRGRIPTGEQVTLDARAGYSSIEIVIHLGAME